MLGTPPLLTLRISATPVKEISMSSWRMQSKLLTLPTAISLTVLWEGLDFQHGFAGFTHLSTRGFGYGF